MLTRPPHQSAQMGERLEELGAEVVYFPTIEIAGPDGWEALDAAIDRLEGYDWIIFTSANGVEYFFERLRVTREEGLAAACRILTCAVGPATARALSKAGGRVDVVAVDSRAEGVLAAIVEHLGNERDLQGLRILLPRAKVAREFLPVELGRRGAHVDAVEAYRTIRPAVEPGALGRWFTERRIDAVVFASPSSVANFSSLLEVDDLSDLLCGVVVASIGPATSEAIRKHGRKEITQPDTYEAGALIDALVTEFAQRPRN